MTAIHNYQSQGPAIHNIYGSIYGGQSGSSTTGSDMGGYFSSPTSSSANMQYFNNVVAPNVDGAQAAYDYATGQSSGGYTSGTSGTSQFRDYVNGITSEANNVYHNASNPGQGNTSGTFPADTSGSVPTGQSSGSGSSTSSFRDYINGISSSVSQTYHQFDTLKANREALQHLTANDNELLKKLDRAAGIGGRDKKVSKKDFNAALNSGDFTEQEKKTIRYLLHDHPSLWDSIAGDDGKATFNEVHDALNSGNLSTR